MGSRRYQIGSSVAIGPWSQTHNVGVPLPPGGSSAAAAANAPGIAHVVPGCRDLAVGTWDVRDAERVDVAVEGVSDAAHVPADAERS
jgi:hypothetical protein